MRVIAGKGMSFKVQGKNVDENKDINVSMSHDIVIKLREGSLIDMAKLKAPISKPKVVIPKSKKPEIKTVNKGEK